MLPLTRTVETPGPEAPQWLQRYSPQPSARIMSPGLTVVSHPGHSDQWRASNHGPYPGGGETVIPGRGLQSAQVSASRR